eukprot:gene8324-17133_t
MDLEITWHLSMRVERPIEGCELSPHPYLKIKGGNLDNSARAKLLDSTPHRFTYQWCRSTRRQICENKSCPRGDTFDPVCWSRFALGGFGLQCTVCDKAGIPRHQTIFCSAECFKYAWKSHSMKHIVISQKLKRKSSDSNDKDDNPDNDLVETDDNNDETGGGTYIEGLPINDVIEIPNEEGREEWTPICHEKGYLPSTADVGCSLRIECKVINTQGDLIAAPVLVHTEPVLASPRAPPRGHLIPAVGGGVVGGASTGGNRFRVVSYNILAEVYATRQAYPYCDAWCLAWPYRRCLLLQELQESQADIICLQEVQADYYESQLLPAMTQLGYDGVYKQKTRESMGSYGKVDGCAVLWRSGKMGMVENYSIEFNECARRHAQQQEDDENEMSRLIHRLSKDNVAQIVVLDLAGPGKSSVSRARHGGSTTQLCVVNTHLYSNPKLADVKLWQTLTLLHEVEAFVAQRDIATVICGDFNSEPHSAVYQLLAHGMISSQHPDQENIGPHSVLPDSQHITHNLELASTMVTAVGEEPAFTNYTTGYVGTLDYIWYSPSRIRVLAVSALPEEMEILAKGEALPSPERPSDHLMVSCDLSLVASGGGGGSLFRGQARKSSMMSPGMTLHKSNMGVVRQNR